MTPPRCQKIQIGAKEFVHLNPENGLQSLIAPKKRKFTTHLKLSFAAALNSNSEIMNQCARIALIVYIRFDAYY